MTGRYDHGATGDRYEMMRTYYAMLLGPGEDDSVGKMKQFVTYFTHGIWQRVQLRVAIYQAKEANQIVDLVDEFFSSDEESSRLVLA